MTFASMSSMSLAVQLPVSAASPRLTALLTPLPLFLWGQMARSKPCPLSRHDAGVQLMFANTYHLMCTLVRIAEGGWRTSRVYGARAPIITDSGGFQVFSLGDRSDNDQPSSRPEPAVDIRTDPPKNCSSL